MNKRLQNAAWLTALTTVASLWMRQAYKYAYARAMHQLEEHRELLDTPHGTIEYADRGTGTPVLVLHGIMGDYLSSVDVAYPLLEKGYRQLTLSRPGYSQSSQIDSKTASAEAEHYLHLLDHLGIERIFIIGISASGPVALTFAREHPDRCAGLIMLAAASHQMDIKRLHLSSTLSYFMRVVHSDVAAWLLYNVMIQAMPLVARFDPVLHERVMQREGGYRRYCDKLRSYFPVSAHKSGLERDIEQLSNLPVGDLDTIDVPTLIIHGREDTAVPYEHSENAAAHISHAQTITYDDAGHDLFITHYDELWDDVLAFLGRISDEHDEQN